jgi:hypothetical protein
VTRLTKSIDKELSVLPDHPTVSILTNCKNGERTVRTCIEAVLAQTYPRIQYVFQDGGSTDGTLEIVREYANRHPGRIRVIQKADSCAEEGFFNGLTACHGEIIGSSMVDEEMLPHAVAWGVEQLKRLPRAGAVYGDVYLTDAEGRVTSTWVGQSFSLEAFLCSEVMPPFAASFFRREAILKAGLQTRKWIFGVGEYEFWLRIAMGHAIHHVPGVMAKYAFHPNTASYRILSKDDEFVSARKAFLEKFFAEPHLRNEILAMKAQAFAGVHLFVGDVLCGLQDYSKAQKHLQQAMGYQPNPTCVLDLAQRLARAGLDWDFKMLRNNLSAHLGRLSAQRIVCYGAGNDFQGLLCSGVFHGHTVVAVLDNNRPKGELVGGVPVIGEADLSQIAHDLVVVTSSKWVHEFRTAAVRRSEKDSASVPVI